LFLLAMDAWAVSRNEEFEEWPRGAHVPSGPDDPSLLERDAEGIKMTSRRGHACSRIVHDEGNLRLRFDTRRWSGNKANQRGHRPRIERNPRFERNPNLSRDRYVNGASNDGSGSFWIGLIVAIVVVLGIAAYRRQLTASNPDATTTGQTTRTPVPAPRPRRLPHGPKREPPVIPTVKC
jgi:hypothetical protein